MPRGLAFLAGCLLALPCAADEPKDTFRKIEKGTGALIEAIGKEAAKAGNAVAKGVKKADGKAARKEEGK